MKYENIEGLNKKVSKIVFGTATRTLFNAVSLNATVKDKEKAFTLLDEVFFEGINTFDCAHHYGEEILGEWMESRKNRDKCVVITKCAHPNQWRHRVNDFDILSDINDSLVKLKTDYIDIYLLHRDNEDVEVSGIVDVLNKLKNQGKINIFGGSNWTHGRIEEANIYAKENSLSPFTVSSPNFGLAEQIADPWLCDAHFGNGCVSISGSENAPAREWYLENNFPIFAYSSLARGLFSGLFKSDNPKKAKQIMDEPGVIGYLCSSNLERLKRCEILASEKKVTVTQVALAWILNQKLNCFPIISVNSISHLKENIDALEIVLTEKELKWLNLEIDNI